MTALGISTDGPGPKVRFSVGRPFSLKKTDRQKERRGKNVRLIDTCLAQELPATSKKARNAEHQNGQPRLVVLVSVALRSTQTSESFFGKSTHVLCSPIKVSVPFNFPRV